MWVNKKVYIVSVIFFSMSKKICQKNCKLSTVISISKFKKIFRSVKFYKISVIVNYFCQSHQTNSPLLTILMRPVIFLIKKL